MVENKQPPLFKYLDVNGANLTLTNRKFWHAKPSDFNDIEDMKVLCLFPEGELESLKIQSDNFTDIILRNLDKQPTCQNIEMRVGIAVLQEVFRGNPDAARIVKEIKENDDISEIYDLGGIKRTNAQTMADVNQYLQENRVLCVSHRNDSYRMWSDYAENSQGIVLRIVPNLEKDSKFKLFKPVQYEDERPPLFPSAIEYSENSLFGNQDDFHRRILDKVIYTKTKKWEYENEYRLVVPIFPPESWNTLPYYPEEIGELYLGLNTSEDNQKKFINLAKQINSSIKIFKATGELNGQIEFGPI